MILRKLRDQLLIPKTENSTTKLICKLKITFKIDFEVENPNPKRKQNKTAN